MNACSGEIKYTHSVMSRTTAKIKSSSEQKSCSNIKASSKGQTKQETPSSTTILSKNSSPAVKQLDQT
jgi:hypothetical protein